MNDLTITATGWAATDPKLHIGPSGGTMCTFRLATTPRRFDRNAGEWVDGDTQWFTVRTFRGGAVTVHESVSKGQPLIVTGRMRTSTWEAADGPRTDLQIDATSLGHDLTRGMATFTRAIGDPSLDGAAAAITPETTDVEPELDATPTDDTALEVGEWENGPEEADALASAR